MFRVNQALLEESVREFTQTASNIDDATDTTGRHSVYKAMGDSINEDMKTKVRARAMELAEPHIGDHATDIRADEGHWVGGRFLAGLWSNNPVVMAHEQGSGKYSTTGPYRITPTNKEALAFEVDGRTIVTEVVIHPGVRGKHFMRQAIREYADEIARNARDEAQETLADAIDKT